MTSRKHARSHVLGRGRQDGFTMVELLIAMILMLVVLGAIFTIWFGLQRTYSFTNDDMLAQDQARSALNEMVELIRTARQPESPPSEDLNMVIVSAAANVMVCWTDTDRDAAHDLELVRFRVDQAGRSLFRDDDQAGDITFSASSSIRLVGSWVSNDASTPLFEYRDGNGNVLDSPVLDPTDIREVSINLRVDVVTDQRPVVHYLRSTVQPRNLRQY